MTTVCDIVLRAFGDSDVDPLYEIQGDRHHMRHAFWADSRATCATWLRRYARSRAANGFAPWTIVRCADDRVVGWGGLGIDPVAPEWGVEVSYFIHPSYTGRGYATTVVGAALRLAFGALALPRVGAFARRENLASVRVLTKCGFAFVRREPGLDRDYYEAHRDDSP